MGQRGQPQHTLGNEASSQPIPDPWWVGIMWDGEHAHMSPQLHCTLGPCVHVPRVMISATLTHVTDRITGEIGCQHRETDGNLGLYGCTRPTVIVPESNNYQSPGKTMQSNVAEKQTSIGSGSNLQLYSMAQTTPKQSVIHSNS